MMEKSVFMLVLGSGPHRAVLRAPRDGSGPAGLAMTTIAWPSPRRPLAREPQVTHGVERAGDVGHLDRDLALVQVAKRGERVRDGFVARVVILRDPVARRFQIRLVARLVT